MAGARPISFLLFLCCSFWSVLLVQCDTKTLTVTAGMDCIMNGQTLEDDDVMFIQYRGAIVPECDISVKAEHKLGDDVDVICFEAITFDVQCSVTVGFHEAAEAFTAKTYSCNDHPALWCSSGSSAFIRILAPLSTFADVYIKAFVKDGEDVEFIEIANKAVIAIGVIIGIVVGVIVIGVVIVIIIICCCCKRRGSRGNVYRQPQHAVPMTVVHTPISPAQAGYPTQQPGYGPQTSPGNYPIGSQPPPTGYPGYPPQQQGFMVYPPMPTEMQVPDQFSKKVDPTAPPPHNDLPPPYPGS